MSEQQIIAERAFGPITRTDLVRYAGAGGDFNPVHHDEVFATSAGYPSVFGHGLLTAAIASLAISEVAGPLAMRHYWVRYSGQVWPGDTLHVAVRADADGADDSAVRRVVLEVTAQAADAEPRIVLTGGGEIAT